jgi:toxin CcdB
MSQFDVFDNPITQARRAYPYIAVLQSDRAKTGNDRIVAPLVPRGRISGTAGRLTPYVKVLTVEHVLLTPSITAIPVAGLREIRDSLKPFRDDIVAALDCLFLGI